MQRLLTLVAVCWVSLVSRSVLGAHTQVNLLLSADEARPGDTVTAAVRLRMDRDWHTYWTNSGASGEATKVFWDLPPGVTAGRIEWPLPEKLGPEDLTTYVYSGEVLLLAPVKLAADLKPGPVDLRAAVTWLECEEVCIPGSNNVTARLVIGPDTKPSPDASLIESWQAKVPKPATGLSARAWWEKPATGDLRPLILEWKALAEATEVDFYPYGSDLFEVQAHTEMLPSESGKIRLLKAVRKFEGDWPREISGVLVLATKTSRQGLEVNLPVSASATPRPDGPVGAESPTASGATVSFLGMLVYAFLGGLILNIMPCVFPVIALKVLGFVRQGNDDSRKIFQLGLIYTLGVLASFLALAAVVIVVRKAGGAASWGMQLQNPQFALALTVLVTLVALNLFGVFEVSAGARVMGRAGTLASRHGASGAFLNGVLATVLATPCTAPYLASALGFAFTQSPAIILLIFAVVGLGLATPYFVLSWRPAWLKFLPKPGAWMERFKVAMGFPMLATAVWLYWFTAPRFGEDGTLWLGLFLVIVSLAAWVWGTFVQRGSRHKPLAVALSVALLAVGYAYALEKELRWRTPVGEGAAEVSRSNHGIAWQPWSPQAVEAARAQGRPVLVDFTARWCITCQLNKRYAIEVPEVESKLREINAVAFIENSPQKDATVVTELNRYGRAGVPLVLVYPRAATKPAIVLPALLTKGLVLEALNRAAE